MNSVFVPQSNKHDQKPIVEKINLRIKKSVLIIFSCGFWMFCYILLTYELYFVFLVYYEKWWHEDDKTCSLAFNKLNIFLKSLQIDTQDVVCIVCFSHHRAFVGTECPIHFTPPGVLSLCVRVCEGVCGMWQNQNSGPSRSDVMKNPLVLSHELPVWLRCPSSASRGL